MRPRTRITAWLLLLILTAGLLSGCWDKRELEETSFVLMLGIDKGKVRKYAVTALIALPAKMAGGGDGGGGGGGGGGGKDDKPYVITTVESPTIAGAVSLMDTFSDRRISLIHAKALFMGDELAREGALPIMDDVVRFRQIRRSLAFVVTKGSAEAFLRGMRPESEKNPVRVIEQMTYNFRHTGTTPAEIPAFVFIRKAHTGYSQPLTYYAALGGSEAGAEPSGTPAAPIGSRGTPQAGEMPRRGGPNVEVVGAAAFRKDRMVGVLSGDEVRAVLMLQGKFNHSLISIPDPRQPDAFIALDVRQGRPNQIQVDLHGSAPHLQATITLEAEILAIQSGIDYTTQENQVELERALAAQLEGGARDAVRKTQGWGTDVAEFGSQVIRQFPTVASWEAYNWIDRYQHARIDVSVRVRLRRFGLQLSPPQRE